MKLSRIMIWLSAVAFILAGGATYVIIRNGKNIETIAVVRKDVVQEVVVTGKTKPVTSVELSFERNGRVAKVAAKVGERVMAGQEIVVLEMAALEADAADAAGNLLAQEAKLAELRKGARAEDVAVQEAGLAKAQQDLANHYATIKTMVQDAYTKTDDAVRAKTAGIFTGSKSTSYQLSFSVCSDQIRINALSKRLEAEMMLDFWKVMLADLELYTEETDLLKELSRTDKNLTGAKSFLGTVSDLLSSDCALGQASLDAYRTQVNIARVAINAVLASVRALQDTIASQGAVVHRAERELALVQAGATAEQIAIQEAIVTQAEARVKSVAAMRATMSLRSPVSGIVTKQDAKIGEIIAPNIPVVGIMSEGALEIEANVPEVSVGRVMMENPVAISYDAFPGETFQGKVVSIDPAETIVDGVVNFKIKISPDVQNENTKSGFTASLHIRTAERANVLALPAYAILEERGSFFVGEMLPDRTIMKRAVEIGIRGYDGFVEIKSGIQEGAQIVRAEVLRAQ